MKLVQRPTRLARLARIAALLVVLPFGDPALARGGDDQWPTTSPEGLQLQKHTRSGAVYVKPGATFSQYDRLALLDCYVQFAKDWQRDYNQDQPGLQGRVTQADMDRITSELAAEFRKVFTEELQTKGGYAIVDSAAPDVLVLRPAILNLIVTAPDLMTPDMGMTVVSSAGQMTLYLELWDSSTNTLLARAIDTEADDAPLAQVGNAVSNRQAADRILRRWADLLRQRLDQVRAQGVAP